jgi:hypothetical protein
VVEEDEHQDVLGGTAAVAALITELFERDVEFVFS